MAELKEKRFYQNFDQDDQKLIKECGEKIYGNLTKRLRDPRLKRKEIYKYLSMRWYVANELIPYLIQ